jgi:AAA domain/Zinc finger C-x8-C-x5-C-x3-H type (and similar)
VEAAEAYRLVAALGSKTWSTKQSTSKPSQGQIIATNLERNKRRICRFFRSTGRCDYGARCRFSHDLSSTESTTETRARRQGRQVPDNPLYDRLRTWKFDIPRNTQSFSPLGSTKLQAFLTTALDLALSGGPDVLQQIVESLASEGGLSRINEAIILLAASSSNRQCLQFGENMLLPLLNILTFPDVTQSFILEKPMGVIHTFLHGVGGSRVVTFVSAATRFLSLSETASVEKSKSVVAVLICLHQIIELNSKAKVVENLHTAFDDLGSLLGKDLTQNHEARRLFQRIKERLQEGSAMPSADAPRSIPTMLPHFAALRLERDQPGLLSPKGPRHDNDHDDVKCVAILPTASEVRSERAEYLPLKDPRSLHLGGAEGLIDRQFRLLREDTVGQLRDIVRAEMENLQDTSVPATASSSIQQNVQRFAYKDVKLMQVTFDRVGGLRARLSFPQPKAAFQKSERVRRQWWEHSKRLCPEALLCLVDATQGLTFFTVCGPEASRSQADSNCSKLLYQDAHRASVIVRLVSPNELDVKRIVRPQPTLTSRSRILCEFPGVLLPSFYPTLKALQHMSTTLDLPFAEIIAPAHTHLAATGIEPPSYAKKPGFKFDLKSIVRNEHLELSVDDAFDYAALAARSLLDDAQQTAVIDALTRKLALIQGPPGTGKSYTGIALIKVLLDNALKARLGPILCVCYTNHALDQLLEHLIKDGVEGIVRIGSRSKSELVKRYNLRDAVQRGERTPTEKRHFGLNKSAIESEAEGAKALLEDVVRPENPQLVKNFLQRTSPAQYRQVYGSQEDEDGFQRVEYDSRDNLSKWLQPKTANSSQVEDDLALPSRPLDRLQQANVWSMSLQERKALHTHWTQTLQNEVLDELSGRFSTIEDHVKDLEDCRKEQDLRVLMQAKVIGVTTSGLARNLDVLRRLESKVIVCEEAGEVLEAHLLTAFLPSVEHAILIGDHQQLKPQIANYELSSENPRGVQYSLDVSLFERLLYPDVPQSTAMPYSTLRTQRRMHPSIAALVRNTLYPGLIDHESVSDHPEIEGMRARLFWFDHDHPESSAERQESTSHTNEFEVEMVAALVHHVVRQSRYRSEDIAVLTPYLGQLFKLRNKLASSFEIVVGDRDPAELDKEGLRPDMESARPASQAKKTNLSNAVRIATVDNFQVSGVYLLTETNKLIYFNQGEEAKVVIISLVRSNEAKRCGFLKTTNRINVLLR